MLIVALAPPAPPCFSSRLSWVEYLTDYAADKYESIRRNRGPLDLRHPEPRFNFGLDFCADCTARHALAMQAEGRCHPAYLRDLAPAAPVDQLPRLCASKY